MQQLKEQLMQQLKWKLILETISSVFNGPFNPPFVILLLIQMIEGRVYLYGRGKITTIHRKRVTLNCR